MNGEPARIFESLPMTDRDAQVGKALELVDATVRATADSPAEQLAALQDIGATLFRQSSSATCRPTSGPTATS